MRHLEFNELKAKTLTIFATEGPLGPPEFAVFARFYPIRAAYTYLRRLHRWGLLLRSRDRRGRLLYTISARGLGRLTWLRAKQPRMNALHRTSL